MKAEDWLGDLASAWGLPAMGPAQWAFLGLMAAYLVVGLALAARRSLRRSKGEVTGWRQFLVHALIWPAAVVIDP
jgi:hypothetical protein